VVTARAVTRVGLSDPAEIARLAVRYRAEVEQSLANPMTGRTTGDALAAAVLMPVLPLVPAGSTVVLVADRALHDVNFEMLPVGSPRRYWIEDVTIEVAPSLGILATARPRAARPSAPVLLVGDPAPQSPGLAPLAHAGSELDAIASAMALRPVTTLRGREATPAAYRNNAPGQFGLIHFAAHATVNTASPLDSAIELSAENGSFKLYARDVAAVRLEADLVTISACRSAAARAYASEGLVGFAWAFLRAGSRRVVAGLWDVDDRSTSTLMAGFYRGLAAGLGPAPALRAAKLEAIARGGNFAKPYYWAPFQLYRAAR
jgi:CHAT domain-containing protein